LLSIGLLLLCLAVSILVGSKQVHTASKDVDPYDMQGNDRKFCPSQIVTLRIPDMNFGSFALLRLAKKDQIFAFSFLLTRRLLSFYCRKSGRF